MEHARRLAALFLCLVTIAAVICINARAEEIVTNSRAVILYDPSSGRIVHSKNERAKLQMASTTKIMTTVLTLESGDIDEPFTVDSEAIKVEGSSMGLCEGDTVTKRTLCYGMLLPSGNDAANASAVAVAGDIGKFVDLMNKKAADLGLSSTHFVTPSGLDDFTSEHYSTAEDMAKLTAYALKNEIFREICSTPSISLDLGGRSVTLYNTNKLLSSCDGVYGVKTGFTDKAGRCLVTACRRNGIDLICVTFGDPTDWIDHSKLYDYGFSVLEKVDLGGEKFTVPVAGGPDAVLTSGEVAVNLEKGESERVEKKVLLPEFIYYPPKKGDIYGKVIYYLDGGVLAVTDIRY